MTGGRGGAWPTFIVPSLNARSCNKCLVGCFCIELSQEFYKLLLNNFRGRRSLAQVAQALSKVGFDPGLQHTQARTHSADSPGRVLLAQNSQTHSEREEGERCPCGPAMQVQPCTEPRANRDPAPRPSSYRLAGDGRPHQSP